MNDPLVDTRLVIMAALGECVVRQAQLIRIHATPAEWATACEATYRAKQTALTLASTSSAPPNT